LRRLNWERIVCESQTKTPQDLIESWDVR
jgi:hypothetical protein